MNDKRRCRMCGCADGRPCVIGHVPVLCHWVADDLCSACAPLAAVEAELSQVDADVAYRLGLACGEFRKMLGGGGA